MDDDSGRYPWANRQPEQYIATYQYFVDHCRKFAPEARYVWSPQAKRAVAPVLSRAMRLCRFCRHFCLALQACGHGPFR